MSTPSLLEEIEKARACRRCETQLPEGCRPVLRASATAKVLIVGQAPGRRVHASGIPWDDPSGDRLRAWMNVSKAEFYDESRFAIIPAGLCYPGKGKSGDLPPIETCAPLWHGRIRPLLPDIRLTLLIGQYAQHYYLGNQREKTLTATVQRWRDYLPEFLPMPHPSPRNTLWLKRNPWFEAEVIPCLQEYLKHLALTS